MGAICSATKDNPCFNELSIRLVGSLDGSCGLPPDLLYKYNSLIAEGREIYEFFQSADNGLKLYQIATQEKTQQAFDACFSQIMQVSETIVRYLMFRDSLVPALIYTLDYINEVVETPFVMDSDNLGTNVPRMNNPKVGPLVALLAQLFDLCSSIDKKFLSKNFDSSVGIFRRLISDRPLDIDHPLYELSTSQTISMALSGPGPTLRAFVQSCTYVPALEPQRIDCQHGCTCNCGNPKCACGCAKHCSCHSYVFPSFFFELTGVQAPQKTIEMRCGFLLTILNGILGTLKRDPSLRTGLDSVYYRRVLLCGTACLNALYTDYLQRFVKLNANAATGVFHSTCPLSILGVCTAITSGEDENLFLRYNLSENARKTNDKPIDSNAILNLTC